MNRFVQVAIDTPLRRVFDYRIPASVDVAGVRAGQRVRVPFGKRRVVGVVTAVTSQSAVLANKLKAIVEVLDAEPVFNAELFALLMWAADYYRHPVGEVLAAALPAALRSGAAAVEQEERWRLTEHGEREWSALSPRAVRLRRLAEALASGANSEALSAVADTWREGLRELEKRGLVEREYVVVQHCAPSAVLAQTGHELNDAQRAAVEKVLSSLSPSARRSPIKGEGVESTSQFRTWLLHGVTGSGKTEVYLRVIAEVVATGGQALVLVPEIALTPQLVSRFQERFAAPIAVLHSALNDGERLQAWRAARSGAAPIVIGTRSAVFAPMTNLKLIIVDEEHDASYKQQEGFRYSARDLVAVRAQRLMIPVVLGSATPSLESFARAKRQPDDLLALPQRAGAAQPPTVRLVDLRKHAHGDGIATPALLTMQTHLQNGGQVLVYLNRRGFAPVLFCSACGWSAACKRCDARMTVHNRENKLACHHCGYECAIPSTCASCNAPAKPVGQGTERIEDSLGRLFPKSVIARIDRDSVRRKGELEAALARVNTGEVNILVGTQMLTKGHHFPDVSLVVIVNADQGLFGTDFRASERLAQSIVQVAGRAGRAERSGEVLIQTEFPEHPLLGSLLSGGYSSFAEQALGERQQAGWPPFARLALLRAEAATMRAAVEFLDAAKRGADSARVAGVKVLGPAPAPMARRAGHYRSQLLIRSDTHTPIQKLLSRLLPQLESLQQAKRVRWTVDVDPAELF